MNSTISKCVAILAKSVAALLLSAALVLIVFSVSPIYDFEKPRPFEGPDIFNPYAGLDTNVVWKKANFHTHTRVDGLFNECPEYPDKVLEDYRRLGYDILTFSNHNRLTAHPADSNLQVNVYEHGYNLFKFHKLVFGCKSVMRFDHILPLFTSQKQWQYDLLAGDADIIQMNHPDRTANTTPRSMRLLTGYRLMEADCGVSTELTHWDEALSAGHYSFCVANDDCHNSADPRRAGIRCNWLDCPSGRYEDIRDCLTSGRFFSMRVPFNAGDDMTMKFFTHATLPKISSIGAYGDTLFVAFSMVPKEILASGQNHTILKTSETSWWMMYVMKPEDRYVRFTATFNDGIVLYTNAFARYNAKEAASPYRVSPHPVNWPLTILFNLALLALATACILGFRRLFPHVKDKARAAV